MYMLYGIIIINICFQCCLLFSMMPPQIVGDKMEAQSLYDSVNILLSLQVRIVIS